MAPTLLALAGYSVLTPYDDPHMGISVVPLLLGQERGRYLHRDVVGRASFKRNYFLYPHWRWELIYPPPFPPPHPFQLGRAPPQRPKPAPQRAPPPPRLH